MTTDWSSIIAPGVVTPPVDVAGGLVGESPAFDFGAFLLSLLSLDSPALPLDPAVVESLPVGEEQPIIQDAESLPRFAGLVTERPQTASLIASLTSADPLSLPKASAAGLPLPDQSSGRGAQVAPPGNSIAELITETSVAPPQQKSEVQFLAKALPLIVPLTPGVFGETFTPVENQPEAVPVPAASTSAPSLVEVQPPVIDDAKARLPERQALPTAATTPTPINLSNAGLAIGPQGILLPFADQHPGDGFTPPPPAATTTTGQSWSTPAEQPASLITNNNFNRPFSRPSPSAGFVSDIPDTGEAVKGLPSATITLLPGKAKIEALKLPPTPPPLESSLPPTIKSSVSSPTKPSVPLPTVPFGSAPVREFPTLVPADEGPKARLIDSRRSAGTTPVLEEMVEQSNKKQMLKSTALVKPLINENTVRRTSIAELKQSLTVSEAKTQLPANKTAALPVRLAPEQRPVRPQATPTRGYSSSTGSAGRETNVPVTESMSLLYSTTKRPGVLTGEAKPLELPSVNDNKPTMLPSPVETSFGAEKPHDAERVQNTPRVQYSLEPNQLRPRVRLPAEIQLKLEPEGLGTVRLQLRTVENHLTARVTVQSEAAQLAVKGSLGELQRTLTEAGLVIDRFEVSVGQTSSISASHPDTPGQKRQHAFKTKTNRRYQAVAGAEKTADGGSTSAGLLMPMAGQQRLNLVA